MNWTQNSNKIEYFIQNESKNDPETIFIDLINNYEDLTNELKRQNPKAIDFFKQNPTLLSKLIEYITIESPDPSDLDRGHKFPLGSSEVFAC